MDEQQQQQQQQQPVPVVEGAHLSTSTKKPTPSIADEDLAFLLRYRAFRGKKPEEEDAAALLLPTDALRQHILHLWRSCLAEASIHYRCVRELMFLHSRIDRHPHYTEVLATRVQDPQALYLDLGCCFGTDTRRVIVDGWSEENVVAVDVIPDFWNYGLKLYDDAEIIKCKFLLGDVTCDRDFVEALAARGLFAHVWTGQVLHVLDEAKVEALIRSIFALLKPGGSYFGTCVGSADRPSVWQPEYHNRRPAFLHNASSLKNLLQRIGFENATVWEVPSRMPNVRPEGPEASTWVPKQILAFQAKKPATLS